MLEMFAEAEASSGQERMCLSLNAPGKLRCWGCLPLPAELWFSAPVS